MVILKHQKGWIMLPAAKWQHIQINRNLILLSETLKIRLNCRAEFHRVKSCYFEAAHKQWWWTSNWWIILTVYLKNPTEERTVVLLQSMSPVGWPRSSLLFFFSQGLRESSFPCYMLSQKHLPLNTAWNRELVCLYSTTFSHFFLHVKLPVPCYLNSVFLKVRWSWKA